jgi:hypothetical protein
VEFPQYRKLSNNKVFFKIHQLDFFEERKLMGSKIFHYEIKALQYPEKLKILDMLKENGYEQSNESEWRKHSN